MSFEWRVERLLHHKLQGDVWAVTSEAGQRGYFKVPGRRRYYGGTMIANELIAANLAAQLGFPVAQLSVEKLRCPDGIWRKGIVSIERQAKELVSWSGVSAGVKRNPQKNLHNLHRLGQLVVFDAWILNTDRASGRNLILYRNNQHSKYDWYLIDHGNTLYGSPYRWRQTNWQSPHWEDLWRYYYVPQGLLRLQSRRDTIEAMINEICSIPACMIQYVVDTVPAEYLPSRERYITLQLLLARQAKLRQIMVRWLDYRGKKEYKRLR